MSAPTPAPGDDRPREGYYPDPSIPGYVRYWNGASWVPGTSRPAPKDGERLTPPPGIRPAVPAVEETGPHFFDEDPQPTPSAQAGPGAWPSEGQGGPGDGQGGRGAWNTDAHSGPGHVGYGEQGTAGHAGYGDQGTAAQAGARGQGAGGQAGRGGQGAGGHAGTGGQGAGASGAGTGGHGGGQPGAGHGGQGAGVGGHGGGQPGAGHGGQGAGVGGHGGGQPGAGGHGGGDGRAAWGTDPRVPAVGSSRPGGQGGRPDGAASAAPGEGDDQDPGGTFIFRRPVPGPAAVKDDGTMTFRPVPGQARRGAQPASGPQTSGPQTSGPQTSGSPASGADPAAGSGFGAHGAPQGPGFAAPASGPDAGAAGSSPASGSSAAPGGVGRQGAGPGFAAPASGNGAAPGGFGPQGPVGSPASPASSAADPAPASPAAGPGFGAGKAAAARAGAAQTPPQAQPAQAAVAPSVPAQGGAPVTPVTSGPGGGQASWAQQVHQLAGGDEQPVAPWKPPVEDPFQAAARRQAAARPAGLGKRLVARLIDTLIVGAVTAAAAVPLGLRAADHIQQKIDAAKLSGREVTVWLLDGTTGTSLGIVLAVLLLVGVGYEVLPTAKWGNTLGKRLLGLEVRDIEAHEPPTFGAALRRWLVYSVPGLLGIGIVGVLWCLFDRPWRQCWHDKAAHTFVAG
ncbi:RDD family protein [Streptomyces sp. NPDC007251]|uniref:RDD family protein n=1 Tax=Streptomyces sp. NPDC007251 TaxID=3154483 RepID=UPI00340CA638